MRSLLLVLRSRTPSPAKYSISESTNCHRTGRENGRERLPGGSLRKLDLDDLVSSLHNSFLMGWHTHCFPAVMLCPQTNPKGFLLRGPLPCRRANHQHSHSTTSRSEMNGRALAAP